MNTGKLQGKTALVTGGARRVGAAIVRMLHASGANVVIHFNASAAEAQRLVADLEAIRPGSAAAYGLDLREEARLPALVQAVTERFGALDILVNNASSFYPTPLGRMSAAHWDDLMGTNLRAPLFLTQSAATSLKRARGLVINMVDIHGMRPLGDYTIYSCAKAGLVMLTKALSRELAPEVRVNGIAPGPVLWPEQGMDPALQQRILERTPLHRVGEPEDIARAALFFAADAPFVTGQILAVDGGRSVGW